MQRIYVFQDTDPTGKEEYDISGEAFRALLHVCCRYSRILTLRFPQPIPAADALEPYRIPYTDRLPIDIVYAHDGAMSLGEVRFYRVCPEIIAILPTIADSIFKWLCGWGYTNPEDPVFYRSDGSMFFWSCVHDGICMLAPRENEDVSALLADPLWRVCGMENDFDISCLLTYFRSIPDAQERNRLAIQFADYAIEAAIPHIVEMIQTHEQIGSLIYALRCYPTIPIKYLADFAPIVANGCFEAAHESYLLIAQYADCLNAETYADICAALRQAAANGCQNRELVEDLLEEFDAP